MLAATLFSEHTLPKSHRHRQLPGSPVTQESPLVIRRLCGQREGGATLDPGAWLVGFHVICVSVPAAVFVTDSSGHLVCWELNN